MVLDKETSRLDGECPSQVQFMAGLFAFMFSLLVLKAWLEVEQPTSHRESQQEGFQVGRATV